MGPYGPWPMAPWAWPIWAHGPMGPYGPWPIWAHGPMGPWPMGPRIQKKSWKFYPIPFSPIPFSLMPISPHAPGDSWGGPLDQESAPPPFEAPLAFAASAAAAAGLSSDGSCAQTHLAPYVQVTAPPQPHPKWRKMYRKFGPEDV